MLIDPHKLETLVTRLNQLYYQGAEYVIWIQDEYKKAAPKGQPAIDSFIQRTERILLDWRGIVITLLMDELGNGREAASLFLVKNSALSIGNYPEKLSGLVLAHKYKLEKLEQIIVQLEEKLALSIRREIAEKEYDTDIVYHLDYNPTRRLVIFNEIEWHTLNMGSANHKFFEYVWAHAGQVVTVSELREKAGIKDKKISTILADMGFIGNIKKIFFPQANDKESVQLLQIIRKQDIYRGNLPILTRDNILELAPKKKKTTKKD